MYDSQCTRAVQAHTRVRVSGEREERAHVSLSRRRRLHERAQASRPAPRNQHRPLIFTLQIKHRRREGGRVRARGVERVDDDSSRVREDLDDATELHDKTRARLCAAGRCSAPGTSSSRIEKALVVAHASSRSMSVSLATRTTPRRANHSTNAAPLRRPAPSPTTRATRGARKHEILRQRKRETPQTSRGPPGARTPATEEDEGEERRTRSEEEWGAMERGRRQERWIKSSEQTGVPPH